MSGSLRHRGPDGEGAWVDGAVAFGHRRLKIIDLSDNARQPMSNRDGSIWITFNGEIYNYQDHISALKQKGYQFKSTSDTEIILHLYEEHGIDCLKHLNGMFAFAIWDKRKNEGYLVRDRLGIKPLHYIEVNRKLIFASEIKAILKHPDVSREVDFQSLGQYLSFDYVPAPNTILRNVKKLEPGHCLKIKQGSVESIQYWSVSYSDPIEKKSAAEYAEALLDVLKRSVRRHLISDVPLGAFLSGGIDSSSICVLMRELGVSKIKTFHIGFEEESFDETKYARQVAAYLGTEHHSEILSVTKARDLIPDMMDFLDEPFGDASFLPTLLLSQFTKKHVTVSLSGDGGDEIFAGYPTYQAHSVARSLGWIPKSVWQLMRGLTSQLPVSDENLSTDYKLKKFIDGMEEENMIARHYRWLGSFDPKSQADLLSADVCAALGAFDPYQIAKEYGSVTRPEDWLGRLLHCDQRFYLQDNMLVKIDRATMAASLEGRVPFLDHEVVEFATKLPSNLKLNGLITKYILKKTMKHHLPDAIINRKKKGFGIPVAKWFKAELKPFLKAIFEPAKIKREGFLNPAAVSKLLSEHFEGKFDHRKQIYTLLNFELWLERYIRKSD